MVTKDDMIRVLVVEPGEKPYEKMIPNTLSELQQLVGGYIETVFPFEDPVVLICNEEAKLQGLDLNRGLYDKNGNMYDIISGTFLLATMKAGELESLSDEQMEKYQEIYKTPPTFHVVNGCFQVDDEMINKPKHIRRSR